MSEKPEGVCDECFAKSRVAHKIGVGDLGDTYLIGIYCVHTKTGAIRGEEGDIVGDWNLNHSSEAVFWHSLRQSARFLRGEITQFQQAMETTAFAKQQRNKRP